MAFEQVTKPLLMLTTPLILSKKYTNYATKSILEKLLCKQLSQLLQITTPADARERIR